MNILILEDEPRNAKRLIRLLNDIDRTFIVEGPLASIKETVEFFQSGKTTDLILADIRLTDGLSFEALKYAPATVPIIFTTAYDEYAVQAFKFNSFDYLLKPLDPDELKRPLTRRPKPVRIIPTKTCNNFLTPYRRTSSVIGSVSYFLTVTDIKPCEFRTSTTSKQKTRRYISVSTTALPKWSMCQWMNLNTN